MSTSYPDNAPHLTHQPTSAPEVRKISVADLRDALRLGWEDFKAVPSHAVMLCVIYPILGLLLARIVMGYSVIPLLFPLTAGFALIGPFAALGLYELSRRREAGEELSAAHALDVFRSPSFGSMLALGAVLMIVFALWIATAQAIYVSTFGYQSAASVPHFVQRVLTTPEGWRLIVLGCGAGAIYAAVAFCLSVVSFPMMLDRNCNVADAVTTSFRVVAANPGTMIVWGIIVAGFLFLGAIPALLGLTVVIPLLGHATWHVYRKAITPDLTAKPEYRDPPPKPYAADFPLSLFQWRGGDRRK